MITYRSTAQAITIHNLIKPRLTLVKVNSRLALLIMDQLSIPINLLDLLPLLLAPRFCRDIALPNNRDHYYLSHRAAPI